MGSEKQRGREAEDRGADGQRGSGVARRVVRSTASSMSTQSTIHAATRTASSAAATRAASAAAAARAAAT